MKGFSNQLFEKRKYIKNYLEETEGVSRQALDKISCQFDQLINLQQFLLVAGLKPATRKVKHPNFNHTVILARGINFDTTKSPLMVVGLPGSAGVKCSF